MELQSLLIGICFSLGVFGIKTGSGLTCLFDLTRGIRWKILLIIMVSVAYLVLFEAAFVIAGHMDGMAIFRHVETILGFGMGIHLIMAVGLAIWGWVLLIQPLVGKTASRAWIIMVIPCPVCISAILVTVTFLVSGFPEASHGVILDAWLVFMGIVLSTMLLLKFRFSAINQNTLLGLTMLAVAAYFILSVMILPHFQDLDKIYRIASFSQHHSTPQIRDILEILAILLGFSGIGFVYTTKQIKGNTP